MKVEFNCLHIIGVSISLLFTLSTQAESPTFDCTSIALGSVEKMICGDKELTSMDLQLAQVYSKAKAIDAKLVKGMLVAEQRGWIKGRNDCWKESDLRSCIMASYLRRTAELQARYRLLSPTSTTSYVCGNNSAHELLVSLFPTKQRVVVAEYGDQSFYLFEDVKDHFQGRNESLLVRGESVEFVAAYGVHPVICNPRLPVKAAIDPSWDLDGDGLNDCEKDGGCDHTADYSIPRK